MPASESIALLAPILLLIIPGFIVAMLVVACALLSASEDMQLRERCEFLVLRLPAPPYDPEKDANLFEAIREAAPDIHESLAVSEFARYLQQISIVEQSADDPGLCRRELIRLQAMRADMRRRYLQRSKGGYHR